eukprot:g17279.t1
MLISPRSFGDFRYKLLMPPKGRKRKSSHRSSSVTSSSSSLSSLPAPRPSSFPARSLDDDDDDPAPAPSSAASSSRPVSLDPHAVELCESLLTLHERLKGLEKGRFAKKEGCSDVFEVARDRVGGSLTITRLRENVPGLSSATKQASEDVANEIAKRTADMAGLEEEITAMQMKIRKSDPNEAETFGAQLIYLLLTLEKHDKVLQELKSKSEVEVKVEVERVHTQLKLLKEETVAVQKEAKMVPLRDEGTYVIGRTRKGDDDDSDSDSLCEYCRAFD